ncbi:hypothetical protein CDL12_12794 [Handroanthus impetiginosus]|uniref:Bifunctional inhibitor/plant lipid transfer protein/seed storage helical domain-containing protein n=1 Tax=Handroanthus impetiginosus TaxID=429701 RepID=A0A2G9HB77_9LAMI|nr:hypothetical protein CDL12_12794 [Handroanthus impetiginosus]
MATKMYEMGFFLVLAFILCNGATAQSSCSSTLLSLSPCVSYVTGNLSTPSSLCCSSLASVVRSQPRCLCPLLNGGGSTFGIAINQTLALALPNVCNVVTPPVSQCNAAAPAPSSIASPTDGSVASPTDGSDKPAEAPTTTTAQSTPAGSKTVPNTRGSPSGGSTITTSFQLTAFALLVAVWIVKF